MKFVVVQEQERIFYGKNRIISLDKFDETLFGKVWDDSMKFIKDVKHESDLPAIGLETYPSNFLEMKEFEYAALFRVSNTEGLDNSLVRKLPAGNYIKFPVKWGKLGPEEFQKVYKFLEERKINFKRGFDYEEYPSSFDHTDPECKVYICLMLNE